MTMIEHLFWIVPWAAFAASMGIVIRQHGRLERVRHQLELALEERAHWHGEAMRCEARARGVGGKGGAVSIVDAGGMPRAVAGVVA
jgi:hypothetical protein